MIMQVLHVLTFMDIVSCISPSEHDSAWFPHVSFNIFFPHIYIHCGGKTHRKWDLCHKSEFHVYNRARLFKWQLTRFKSSREFVTTIRTKADYSLQSGTRI